MFVSIIALSKLLFRPMALLQAGAERIGQGELGYQLDMVRQDEIGQGGGCL